MTSTVINQSVPWTSVESKWQMPACDGQLETADPNTWGYFSLLDGRRFAVHYCELGLKPFGAIFGDRLLIGIDEVVACIELRTLALAFRHRMPTIFHRFVSVQDVILIQDEVGFLSLSWNGIETWKQLTTAPIQDFLVQREGISGKTIDGSDFFLPFS